ncbi:LOW QUALITY PROTEIN: hypothetical protein V2J09_009990 [Rumex salicifolius]
MEKMRENICTLAIQTLIRLPPELFLLFVFSILCFRFLEQRKKNKEKRGVKMAGSEITFLVEDLEAVLEMNRLLEEENKQLKQEVTRLKAQVSAFKAHDTERKNLLWKKIQYSAASDAPAFPAQQKKQNLAASDPPVSPVKVRRPIAPPPEPPRTPEKKRTSSGGPAPPPPPLPSKSLVGGRAVKRVPEVIEFYRYLTRKSAQLNTKGSSVGIPSEVSNRNMIGEIEDRSTYLSAIKSDVETQGELINRLMHKIENAAFTDISAVEAFVKWLDGELSCLVDERAVLKHFPRWPERKADALREAACSYRDLRTLESEILGFKDHPHQSLNTWEATDFARQASILERSVGNVERTREGTSKRYRELQIPWEWMMDSGFIGKIKLSSLKLAMEYMKKVNRELQSPRCTKMDELMLQGVRFAYRVHQFAGGFDMETMKAFEELKQLYSTNHSQTQ